MFKFFKHLLLFTVFSGLGSLILIYGIGEYGATSLKKNFLSGQTSGYNNTVLRLQDVEKMEDVDVLILGSSHAYRGLDTRIFSKNNLETFNLGSSAQTPIQTEMLVRKYLRQLNPKVVIYEVNPGPFEIDGVESALDILSNSQIIDWKAVRMASNINNIKIYNSLIFYLFKKNITVEGKIYRKELTNGVDTYIKQGGYVERVLTFNKPVEYSPKKLVLRESQLEAFERTLEILSKSGTEVFLIRTPVTGHLYNSFLNNDQVDLYFSSKGKYLSLQEKLQLDDSLDFFDSHHLNQNGAIKTTKETIKILERDGALNH